MTPHKYCEATVNNRPVRPIVTNVAPQSIEVTAGRSGVEKRDGNALVIAGGVISVLTTIARGALATFATGRNY